MKPELTILILQYNGRKLTENLLESLYDKEKENIDSYKIILVDNASTEPNGFEEIREKYPKIQYIEHQKNYGFAKGINRVCKDIATDYILMLNNDIILKNDAITKSFQALLKRNGDGITCKMLDGDSKQINHYSLITNAFNLYFFMLTGLNLLWINFVRFFNIATRVSYITGGFLILRFDKFKEVGFFGEDYFMYTEDLELMIKLNKANAKMYFHPDGEIIHYDGSSSAKVWDNRTKKNMIINQKMHCLKKYYPYSFPFIKFALLIREFIKYPVSLNYFYIENCIQIAKSDGTLITNH